MTWNGKATNDVVSAPYRESPYSLVGERELQCHTWISAKTSLGTPAACSMSAMARPVSGVSSLHTHTTNARKEETTRQLHTANEKPVPVCQWA